MVRTDLAKPTVLGGADARDWLLFDREWSQILERICLGSVSPLGLWGHG